MHLPNAGIFKRTTKVDFRRVREIVSVLSDNGLDYFVERLRLQHKLPIWSQIKEYQNLDELESSLPERMRKVLEQLGPTYIKLGQILSTRPDLIGEKFAAEFSTLQDNVPPFDSKIAFKIIERELKKPIKEVFSELHTKPLASASLAQVHYGVLKNGQKIVVKVQRPGAEKVIDEDIAILRYFAKLLERYFPEWKIYNFEGIIAEFERSVHRELDFKLEEKNIMRFRDQFKKDETVFVPKAYPHISTEKIITMDYVDGKKLNDLIREKNPSKKFNKKLIAQRGAEAFFKQILEHGFFHADPHPGNILILKNNVFCLIDFGMMGKLDNDMLNDLVDLFIVLITSDVKGMTAQLARMGLFRDDIDLKAFHTDLEDIMDNYYGLTLKDISMSEFMQDLFKMLSKYNIKIPRDYMLLSRALVLIEGVGKKLDPGFNAIDFFEPYAKKVTEKKFSPKEITRKIRDEFFDFQTTLRNLPNDIRKIISLIENGKVKIEFEHKNLDIFARNMEHITNKLSIAVIVAALLVGSALIMQVTHGPMIFGFPLLGVAGLTASILLCLLLLFSIWRYRI